MATTTRTVEDELTRLHDRTPDSMVIMGNYIIIGCGGVGTWTAIILALSSDPENTEIVLIDDDSLEVHNLNRLPFPIIWAFESKKKAEALASYLQFIRPTLKVIPLTQRIESREQLLMLVRTMGGVDAIIDATDNPRTQDIIHSLNNEYDILSVHYDGESFTVEWKPKGWRRTSDWTLDETAGYRVFPSTAFTPALASALAVYLLARRPRQRVLISSSMSALVEKLKS